MVEGILELRFGKKRQFGELLFLFLEALILSFGSRETFYAFGRFEVAIFRSHKAIRSLTHFAKRVNLLTVIY